MKKRQLLVFGLLLLKAACVPVPTSPSGDSGGSGGQDDAGTGSTGGNAPVCNVFPCGHPRPRSRLGFDAGSGDQWSACTYEDAPDGGAAIGLCTQHNHGDFTPCSVGSTAADICPNVSPKLRLPLGGCCVCPGDVKGDQDVACYYDVDNGDDGGWCSPAMNGCTWTLTVPR